MLACAAALLVAASLAKAGAAPPVRLIEVGESAGLDFVYQHSPTPEKYFVESVPGGLAVFDYFSFRFSVEMWGNPANDFDRAHPVGRFHHFLGIEVVFERPTRVLGGHYARGVDQDAVEVEEDSGTME